MATQSVTTEWPAPCSLTPEVVVSNLNAFGNTLTQITTLTQLMSREAESQHGEMFVISNLSHLASNTAVQLVDRIYELSARLQHADREPVSEKTAEAPDRDEKMNRVLDQWKKFLSELHAKELDGTATVRHPELLEPDAGGQS